ncbi:putative Diguanylate cyclase [Candidatus Accumulibacter aalborgensis]|uniref:Putative Diguanylate cyclase n=1 Tax=Candidatus Accumulibacter aalborgensis TaxID=1860102 RepID=A0A1A8XMZ0_9PROT|nr:diguanylate cyclase [Candidatus Accumulibacter aalborgensis]SBT06525.1 putative Diguanylate cyclase [Candidatus Accumulibacter aalborgensis]
MNVSIFQWRWLKTRITFFTLAIFLTSIWSLAFYTSRVLREDIEQLLGDQQFSTVSFIAADLNQELGGRFEVLAEVAASLTPDLLSHPAVVQKFLEGRLLLAARFNAGSFVVRLDGTAIADVPLSSGRMGVSYSDQDYIVAALRDGRATIGRPFIGKGMKGPVFVMATPIRDRSRQVIGALCGVTSLELPSFLDQLSKSSYGKTGGYVLVAPQYRLIVTATDPSRVMATLPGAGINPTIDRFIAGYEGTVVYVSAVGVEILTSSKRIPVVGWDMVAILPTAEAFAPIRAMQQRTLFATLFFTLLAAALTWWMVRRQLFPLVEAANMLAAVPETNEPPQPLPIARLDEIGELIGSFNRLLAILAQQEAALREQKEFFRLIAENLDGFVAVLDSEGRRLYNSPSYARLLGKRNISGTSSFADIHPDDRERVMGAFRQAVATGIGQRLEFRFVMADGRIRLLESRSGVIRDDAGRTKRVVVVSHDVTERKQAEDKIHHLAFHDALTRLPNRLTLDDRLRQAMVASKRSGCYGALMFIDLDNFKPLNDTHGHEFGDLLLIEVAGRLKSCIRETDTVARFGGDEFVVVLSDLQADEAESTAQVRTVAEKIRATLSQSYRLTITRDGKPDTSVEHQCTASIGVTLFISHGASPDTLLKWADAAMYQAKEEGRNRICFNQSQC